MSGVYLQYVTAEGPVARWHGGAYIELGSVVGSGWEAEWQAYDVINVYDYALGAPAIDFTPEAMKKEVDEYLADEG